MERTQVTERVYHEYIGMGAEAIRKVIAHLQKNPGLVPDAAARIAALKRELKRAR